MITETKIISATPCTGKTTVGNIDKYRYMDLEFRETASSRGLSIEDKQQLYDHYIEIIKLVYHSNYYEYLFVTDNSLLLERLIDHDIPFSFLTIDFNNKDERIKHKHKVLQRNDKLWYESVIVPRIACYDQTIDLVKSNSKNQLFYFSEDRPYVSDFLYLI